MRDLVSSFLAASLAEVHRYGGTAPQFTGDGFWRCSARRCTQKTMCSARCSPPWRSAALGGRGDARRHKLDLPVRIGIHTGPVVFGPVAGNCAMDHTAIGDTANVAARSKRPPSRRTILFSEATYAWRRAMLGSSRSARSRSKVRPIRSLPIGCSRCRNRAAHRPSPAVADPLSTAERHGAFEQFLAAGREGPPAWSASSASPASASRGSSLSSDGHRQRRVTWIEGRCVSYGTVVPYLLVLDLLRSNCGSRRQRHPRVDIAKVRSGLERVGMDPDAGQPSAAASVWASRARRAACAFQSRSGKGKNLRNLPPADHQFEPRTAACRSCSRICIGSTKYRKNSSVSSQNISASSAYSNAGDLSAGVPSALDRQILRWTGAAGALSRDDSLDVVRSVPNVDSKTDAPKRSSPRRTAIRSFSSSCLHAGEATRTSMGLMVPDTIHDVVMARIDRLPDRPSGCCRSLR